MTVVTAPLDHPDGVDRLPDRVWRRGIAYLTDTEVRPGGCEAQILELARDADLMIYDCTYTEQEIASRTGWGHSTWRRGAALADAAGAKTFCLFHHDPAHDDAFMDAVAAEAGAARPGTIVAQEGLLVSL